MYLEFTTAPRHLMFGQASKIPYNKHNKPVLLAAFVLPMVLFLVSCAGGSPQWRKAEGAVWGTTYSIKYYSSRDLSDSIIAEMRLVEQSLSMFDPNSNVSRINSRLTDTMTLMTAEVFIEARAVSERSGGMFDPTVGPLVDLWGFGRDRDVPAVMPDSLAVAGRLAGVGISDCSFDIAANRIRLKNAGTQLDFSAIAKGYGVDCVGNVLVRNGVEDFLVEIGGEMSLCGKNPEGNDWHVRIVSPESGRVGNVPLCTLDLTDCCVATSGNYRNFRTLDDGTVVGHTISPITGYPVVTDVRQATVISSRCITADAIATACMAMGSEPALKMADRMSDVSLLLVTVAPDGSMHTIKYGPVFNTSDPLVEAL